MNHPLLALTAIVVLGFLAQWTAWRLHLPSILLLLTLGLLLGPGSLLLGLEAPLLDPDLLLGDLLPPLVSLSVAVILFEGGLTLDLKELRSIGGALLRLCSIGVVVTWIGATLLAALLVGLSWGPALLVGAVLTVTGPTVVGPLLRHVRPRGNVAALANWEGIAVDVVGATLAVLVFHSLVEGHGLGMGTAWGLIQTLFVGCIGGLVGAALIAEPLRRRWIPDALQNPAALAVALGVYAASDSIKHESGLLAVTLIGIALRNQESTPIRHIIEFKENLRTLLISSLFLVLAARVDLASLQALGAREFGFVALMILIIRPASVWLATLGTDMPAEERAFLAFLAPRGIVAAAVSALFGEALVELAVPGMTGAEMIAPLVFLVIIGTVAVYGLGAGPLARRLKLAEASPQGSLFVGSGPFARSLAAALEREGLAAVLVDTNRANVNAARLAGRTALYGNALDDGFEHHIPLFGIGRLVAMTPNDEVNALASLHFTELFGRAQCFQVRPDAGMTQGHKSPDFRGRYLFRADSTLEGLDEKVHRGWRIATTQLTESFPYTSWLEHNGPEAIPLLTIDGEGRTTWLTGDEDLGQKPTAQTTSLVALVAPEQNGLGAG